MPICEEAPGWDSITNGRPSAAVSFCVTRRVTISTELPGPSGITILTGLDGYDVAGTACCPKARLPNPPRATAARKARVARIARFIFHSPVNWDAQRCASRVSPSSTETELAGRAAEV